MGTNKANLLYFAPTKLKKTMFMCTCSATIWNCGSLLNSLFCFVFKFISSLLNKRVLRYKLQDLYFPPHMHT